MLVPVRAPGMPTLVLDATDRAPGRARRFLAERFAEWGIADDYVGRLVVCELVTNAYRHGEGPIVVRLVRDEFGAVTIEVWDAGEGRPSPRAADGMATTGRGLPLLAELTRAWGVCPLDESGKIVWATLF